MKIYENKIMLSDLKENMLSDTKENTAYLVYLKHVVRLGRFTANYCIKFNTSTLTIFMDVVFESSDPFDETPTIIFYKYNCDDTKTNLVLYDDSEIATAEKAYDLLHDDISFSKFKDDLIKHAIDAALNSVFSRLDGSDFVTNLEEVLKSEPLTKLINLDKYEHFVQDYFSDEINLIKKDFELLHKQNHDMNYLDFRRLLHRNKKYYANRIAKSLCMKVKEILVIEIMGISYEDI